MMIDDQRILVQADGSVVDLSYADPAYIFIVINGTDQDLKSGFRITLRCGNMRNDGLKQRLHIRTRFIGRIGGYPFSGRSIDEGAVQLIIRRVQIHQKLQNLFLDLCRTCIRTVDLIHTDDDGQIQGKRRTRAVPVVS